MKEYVRNEKLMGSAFTLGVVAEDKCQADHWLQLGINEIKRIEDLLTEFSPDSTTSIINKNAFGNNLIIDNETYELIKRCLQLSALSKGDFDISTGSLKKLYRFDNAAFELPARSLIAATLKHVGYQKIKLDDTDCSINFEMEDMRISFAAVGKGYASDRVKKLWKQNGVTAGFINASGDLNAFGEKADGTSWKIGIAHPDNINSMLMSVPVHDASVATSGDGEQYFLWKGKRYSHNINPHTGLPLTGIRSVTVFSPSAELSDALATAVYVKGAKTGCEFIDQLPNTHCMIIDDKNKIFVSKNINYEEVAI